VVEVPDEHDVSRAEFTFDRLSRSNDEVFVNCGDSAFDGQTGDVSCRLDTLHPDTPVRERTEESTVIARAVNDESRQSPEPPHHFGMESDTVVSGRLCRTHHPRVVAEHQIGINVVMKLHRSALCATHDVQRVQEIRCGRVREGIRKGHRPEINYGFQVRFPAQAAVPDGHGIIRVASHTSKEVS
jgi:hypothetical protein